MTYWDGTRWVPEAPAPRVPSTRPARRLAGAAVEASLITMLILGLIAGTTFAAKGGNGNGKAGGNHSSRTASTCVVDGNTVTAIGLPTDQVLNFMVTDGSGTSGWVLGWSDTGTWPVSVPDRNGPTTYEFASRTSGPDGTHYDVFSACSADA
jgi:hypothetical protein